MNQQIYSRTNFLRSAAILSDGVRGAAVELPALLFSRRSRDWLIAMVLLVAFVTSTARGQQPGLVSSEFIYEQASFPSCHASTLAETKAGLVAAWFGGTRESAPDVGIWLARHSGGSWTTPVEVANGVQADGSRYPCWNPVLFQPQSGALMLFYKVGPSPSAWWGMLRTSTDAGRTWSDARRLPNGILGPVKNKPLELADGSILSASSAEGLTPAPSWRVHFERSSDGGASWTKVEVPTTIESPGAIQPSILRHRDGTLQAVGRSRAGKVFTTHSTDQGRTWSLIGLTSLPNPNSGTDAVTLADGRHLLIYNHTPKGRTPLNLAVSNDGREWLAALTLETEPGEYSYPAIIQTADGQVHATYTWKRQRIKHVVIDPAKLKLSPIAGETSK